MSADTPIRPAPTGASPSTPRRRAASGDKSRARRFLIPVLAGILSAVTAAFAGVWTFVPSTNAFADPDSWLYRDSSLFESVLTPDAAARVLFALGLAGVVVATVAAAMAAGDRSLRPANGIVSVFGIGFALVVGMGMLSEVALMVAGYLMALIVAGGVVVLGVQVVRTSRIGRWVVVAVAAAVVTVFAADVIPVSALSDLGSRLRDFAREIPSVAMLLGLVSTVLLWALVGGIALRNAGVLDRAGDWVLRHRHGITILAATGPMPYALIRLTWLTPWPQGTAGGEAFPPDVRIWGLMLSSGAWAGVILTIGLIRPWGEVFPRWMPWVAGRRVPVWAAAGPGAVIAAILCVSAIPMVRMFATESLAEAAKSAIVFPLWMWGPALALAVWGYVLHRRRDDQVAVAAEAAGATTS